MSEFSLVDLVSERRSLGLFLLGTVLLGGGAAWLTGRAIAATWRPWWQVVTFAFLLGAAVRFMHFALFQETLLTPYYYGVDSAVCVAFGLIGFRVMRVAQMTGSYGWLNERAGPLRWRRRTADSRRNRMTSTEFTD